MGLYTTQPASPVSPVPVVPPAAEDSSALLARVVGTCPARAARLLADNGSLRALRHTDASTLGGQHGLTRRQIARLHDALDLAACLVREPCVERPQVTSPQDAACLVLPEMGLLESEQMRVLLLNTKNRLIAAITLYNGTVSACHVRLAEVFREAVRCNASALIVVHNHPSGDPTPSPEDVAITREAVRAGQLLDVGVLDHLVVGGNVYTSLRERRLGWES